jgi:hypothetical protein
MGMGQWDLNRGKDIGVKINYALRKTLCRDAIYRVFRSFVRLCLKGKGIKVFPMPNDARCLNGGDLRTALAPPCPMPHAQYPITDTVLKF